MIKITKTHSRTGQVSMHSDGWMQALAASWRCLDNVGKVTQSHGPCVRNLLWHPPLLLPLPPSWTVVPTHAATTTFSASLSIADCQLLRCCDKQDNSTRTILQESVCFKQGHPEIDVQLASRKSHGAACLCGGQLQLTPCTWLRHLYSQTRVVRPIPVCLRFTPERPRPS
jgi:hypothetical protein